jgi:hypothetical protein
MPPELAKRLLFIVSDVHNFAALQEYIAWRKELILNCLVAAETERDLGNLQGQLNELRFLSGLREAAIKDSRDK